MALLKIEAISVGVNTALQELAHTEIPISCYKKQQFFFSFFFFAKGSQVYQHGLGKNTLFSVNVKSVFVKQACRYSWLLHFSSAAL